MDIRKTYNFKDFIIPFLIKSKKFKSSKPSVLIAEDKTYFRKKKINQKNESDLPTPQTKQKIKHI